MKLARALHARPWTTASLASARPYASLHASKLEHLEPEEKPVALEEENLTTPYGNYKILLKCWINEGEYAPPPTEHTARSILGRIREENISRRPTESSEELRSLQFAGHLSASRRPSIAEQDNDRRVGMGSYTSIPAKAAGDCQDNDLHFPQGTTPADLLNRCNQELKGLPAPLQRHFRHYQTDQQSTQDVSGCKVRVLQWNHLSQTLGTKNDNFVCCPAEALNWNRRRWRLLAEILRYQPDVICLQEVDHYSLLQRALGSVGYAGRFVPKPDSPCIYLEDNNGPDGCAIFYKQDKFDMVSESQRVLEVWKVQSNQVVLSLNLRHKSTGREVAVATTHLKARKGKLLSTLRNEQGRDLLDWLAEEASGRPLLLTGDFNADPSEPVYRSVVTHRLGLESAYKYNEDSTLSTNDDVSSDAYTTWKIRETGEQKYILDYIFHSAGLRPLATLDMPSEEEVGVDRLPSMRFPSDHLSLVADFCLA